LLGVAELVLVDASDLREDLAAHALRVGTFARGLEHRRDSCLGAEPPSYLDEAAARVDVERLERDVSRERLERAVIVVEPLVAEARDAAQKLLLLVGLAVARRLVERSEADLQHADEVTH